MTRQGGRREGIRELDSKDTEHLAFFEEVMSVTSVPTSNLMHVLCPLPALQKAFSAQVVSSRLVTQTTVLIKLYSVLINGNNFGIANPIEILRLITGFFYKNGIFVLSSGRVPLLSDQCE